MLRWIPGHKGVEGNELADTAAKEAAKGERYTSPKERLPSYLQNEKLPDSISAIKQWHQAELNERWSNLWKESPRYTRTSTIDPSMPSNRFIKLVATLPRQQTSIYTQLRTRHIPLNHHPHRIRKSPSPHYPICPGRDETIDHFLFDCPQYVRERHILSNTLRHKANSLTYILTSKKATESLICFINSTGQLKTTFGEISLN